MNLAPNLRSVVALRAHIPDDAFTARTLGTLREGSGVVIRESGLVLTIGYLITEADSIWLTTAAGRVVPGTVVGYDQATGFGLVQALGALDLPALELGDSGAARIGDPIVFADGQGQSITGSIIARQEFAGYWEYLLEEALFIAPAHPSWGGAALIGADGNLLGVGSLRLQMIQSGQVTDINMVVPNNQLRPILHDMLTRGEPARTPRPWLGEFAAETNGEVVVMNVADGGPAAEAGIRRGDVISDIRDSDIGGLADFYRKLWETGPAGSEIPLRIVRDGRESWLRVKSTDRNRLLSKPRLQ
jgi:S1-C subfamily serine protease